MTFTGLHTKADIPSKAFHRLKKMSLTDPDEVQLPKEQGEQSGTFKQFMHFFSNSARLFIYFVPIIILKRFSSPLIFIRLL